MTKDDFAFYENQKESRTATWINVVEPLTTSGIEFKRKECNAVMQTLRDCPSTSHLILHLMKAILLHRIPIFLIVIPQVTILHRLLTQKRYRFISLPGQLKSDFLTQLWQWHVIDSRSRAGQALR